MSSERPCPKCNHPTHSGVCGEDLAKSQVNGFGECDCTELAAPSPAPAAEKCGCEFVTICNRPKGHKGQCYWESPQEAELVRLRQQVEHRTWSQYKSDEIARLERENASLRSALDMALDYQIANRGTESAFYVCVTMGGKGKFPKWVKVAEAALCRA